MTGNPYSSMVIVLVAGLWVLVIVSMIVRVVKRNRGPVKTVKAAVSDNTSRRSFQHIPEWVHGKNMWWSFLRKARSCLSASLNFRITDTRSERRAH